MRNDQIRLSVSFDLWNIEDSGDLRDFVHDTLQLEVDSTCGVQCITCSNITEFNILVRWIYRSEKYIIRSDSTDILCWIEIVKTTEGC